MVPCFMKTSYGPRQAAGDFRGKCPLFYAVRSSATDEFSVGLENRPVNRGAALAYYRFALEVAAS